MFMKKKNLFLTAVLLAQVVSAQALKEGTLSNVTRLTNDATRYENPRWSPDGTKISFTGEGYEGLYVMDRDGANAIQLSDASTVGYMHQWSADSREILVRDTRYVAGDNGLERVHAAWAIGIDGAKTRMTADAADMQPAAWRYSKAGAKSIVAPGVEIARTALAKVPSTVMERAEAATTSNVSFICDSENLYIVDAAGNKRLINNGASFCPALSPDGKMVAFNAMDDVVVMNIDGTGKRVLSRGFRPAWVNNSQIVFELTADDGHEYTAGELYIINVNGSGKKALTATSSMIEMNPCVSPDGSKLLFTSFTDGQVYSADLK